jgi:2,4-dienoyl-CoA reductase-like NADH-dependent reductase (Old Yellow Enzyme family)
MAGLFSSIQIRGMDLRNRIVMPPMANNLATDRGAVTPPMLTHYQIRAEQLVSLLVVEHCFIEANGRAHPQQMAIDGDDLMSGLKDLAGAIHQADGRTIVQLAHAGSNTRGIPGQRILAPSAVAHPKLPEGQIPMELTIYDISLLIKTYEQAAHRAIKAGFDGVEIHGAHGYLLNQFYSPLTNVRQDQYGGNREARLRFPLEVVQAVRKVVGDDCPIAYRLGSDDMMAGGLTVEDACYAAPRLVEAGIDLLDISGGFGGSRPEGAKPGYFVPPAEAVKKTVPIPVLVTGGITDPHHADGIISSGKADLVGIGRALLADPKWAVKAGKELVD